MLRRILPALLLAVVLSGCFGYPAETVQRGDQVDLQIRATHAATGLVIVEAPARQVPVGDSPFPPEVDEALLGTSLNGTVRLRTEADPSVVFPQDVTLPRTLRVVPRTQTMEASATLGETRSVRIGIDEQSGFTVAQTVTAVELRQAEATVTAHGNGTTLLEASGVADVTRLVDGTATTSERPFSVVQNVTGTAAFQGMAAGDSRTVPYEATFVTVRYSVTDPAETRKDAPTYGGYLVLEEDADELRVRLDPVEGFIRIVLGPGNPLGFPAGAFLVREVREDEVVMAHSRDPFAAFAGQAADLEMTVLRIVSPAVESDNHGVGHSPVLGSGRAGDGHTDHSH